MLSPWARALERFNLALLPHLQSFYKHNVTKEETNEEIIHELSLAGLVTAGLEGSGTIGGSARYVRSTLGELFLNIGFGIGSADQS